MKPKWKAYLFMRTENVAIITAWAWQEYVNRERAVSMARKNAQDVANFYRNLGTKDPVEIPLDNGGVLFRIPGISNYERWPRVEPINRKEKK